MYLLRLKNIGIIAVLGAAFAVGCGATLAFAQEGGMPPPPPPPSGGGDFGGGYQQRPPEGNYQQGGQQQGGYQPRPMTPQEGMMRGGSEQGMYNQKGSPQEMMKGQEQMIRQKEEMMRDGSQQRGGSWGGPEDGMMRGGGDFDGDSGGEEGDDFEAREAEMQKRQLTEMKRNLRGMEQGLKMIKQITAKLAKQNVPIPSEYATLVSDLTQALAVVKNATEMTDDVQAAMEVIMERGEELRDAGPRLGMLAQWPMTVKQAEAQVRRLVAQFARVKKNKTSATYPELLAKVEVSVGAVSSALAQAKSEASGGDIETAMETLRDGVFEGSQDAYDAMRVLENIANLSRVVKQAEKEIARYDKEATRYEKQGKDVSALRGLIAQMKEKLAEVKSVMSSGNVDHDDLFEVMNSAENIRNDAEAELQHLRGRPSDVEKQFQSSAANKADAAIGKSLQTLKK
ncbi:MAG: hypothetical protein Q8R17_01390 [bacterium]|nr:hypothetical protein [bacterium]